ncbi:MAG: septum formation initiator family protein [Candidatus Omnitrophota bacterium]|nr:septum formation initiator family protein [Candidatus Omnitrophota bacterium]
MSSKKLKAVIVFLIISLLICMFTPGFCKLRMLLLRKFDLIKKISSFEMSNQRLKTEKKQLEEDPVYLEKLTRQKLRVGEPGEVIYRIVPPEE